MVQERRDLIDKEREEMTLRFEREKQEVEDERNKIIEERNARLRNQSDMK